MMIVEKEEKEELILLILILVLVLVLVLIVLVLRVARVLRFPRSVKALFDMLVLLPLSFGF